MDEKILLFKKDVEALMEDKRKAYFGCKKALRGLGVDVSDTITAAYRRKVATMARARGLFEELFSDDKFSTLEDIGYEIQQNRLK